jgi:hypothetical protein
MTDPDPLPSPRHARTGPSTELVLAAVERAENHRAGEPAAVPVWTILEHLDVARRSAAARRVRSQLEALCVTGRLACSRRHGVLTWQVTDSGRRQLRRARRSDRAPVLPESPQHRAWRNARAAAGQEIERFRADLHDRLRAAMLLLDADPQPRSDAWLGMAEELSRSCRLVASASHCLYEWAEPDDAHADVDDGVDDGDERIGRDALAHVRALRAGRRNIALWSRPRRG